MAHLFIAYCLCYLRLSWHYSNEPKGGKRNLTGLLMSAPVISATSLIYKGGIGTNIPKVVQKQLYASAFPSSNLTATKSVQMNTAMLLSDLTTNDISTTETSSAIVPALQSYVNHVTDDDSDPRDP